MAGADSTLIYPEVLRFFDTATFTGPYAPLGIPFEHPIRILKFTNTSTTSAYISWDGFNDHDILSPNSFLLLDISANLELSGSFEAGTLSQIYVRGTAGTGLIYLSAYYGK
jgi:hypothetical protein